MPEQSFSFGDETPPEDAEPIIFNLVGKDLKGKPAGPFKFTCLPVINETRFLRIIKLMETSKLLASAEVIDFLRQSLPDDEMKRFDQLLDRKDISVDTGALGKVFEWLVEAYSNRPTQASSVSPIGHSPTGTTSMGAQNGNNVPTPSPAAI